MLEGSFFGDLVTVGGGATGGSDGCSFLPFAVPFGLEGDDDER